MWIKLLIYVNKFIKYFNVYENMYFYKTFDDQGHEFTNKNIDYYYDQC